MRHHTIIERGLKELHAMLEPKKLTITFEDGSVYHLSDLMERSARLAVLRHRVYNEAGKSMRITDYEPRDIDQTADYYHLRGDERDVFDTELVLTAEFVANLDRLIDLKEPVLPYS